MNRERSLTTDHFATAMSTILKPGASIMSFVVTGLVVIVAVTVIAAIIIPVMISPVLTPYRSFLGWGFDFRYNGKQLAVSGSVLFRLIQKCFAFKTSGVLFS